MNLRNSADTRSWLGECYLGSEQDEQLIVSGQGENIQIHKIILNSAKLYKAFNIQTGKVIYENKKRLEAGCIKIGCNIFSINIVVSDRLHTFLVFSNKVFD